VYGGKAVKPQKNEIKNRIQSLLTAAKTLCKLTYDGIFRFLLFLSAVRFYNRVITGFNTDIEYGGVTYHVQTEDKGLDTPLILSLVYTGGEILASKRSLYNDLISEGFDEKVLTDRLNRQHKLICAAIKQGRIEDLKRMGARDADAKVEKSKKPVERKVEIVEAVQVVEAPMPVAEIIPEAEIIFEAEEYLEPLIDIPVSVIDEVDDADLQAFINEPVELPQMPLILRPHLNVAETLNDENANNSIQLRLFDEKEYRAGDRVDLKIQVTNDENIPLSDVELMIKVLGSSFRPLIFHAKTGEKGNAVVNLQLPRFRSGRAALLVRAMVTDNEVELRRIIVQG
jgi:hypothetical protein